MQAGKQEKQFWQNSQRNSMGSRYKLFKEHINEP